MTEQILMEAIGINGQLELLERKVRIRRKGVMSFMTQGLKGDKEILIKQISSIQFKEATGFTNGYIQFSFLGGKEAKGGIFQATQDENSIMFKKRTQPDFVKIKSMIENKMMTYEEKGSGSSGIHDLEKLAELKDKGIITEDEFAAKKRQILGL